MTGLVIVAVAELVIVMKNVWGAMEVELVMNLLFQIVLKLRAPPVVVVVILIAVILLAIPVRALTLL